MVTQRHNLKVMVNCKTGEYWSREGGFTDDPRDISFSSEDLAKLLKPTLVHEDLVWADAIIEIRYYENRENNESKSNAEDSK